MMGNREQDAGSRIMVDVSIELKARWKMSMAVLKVLVSMKAHRLAEVLFVHVCQKIEKDINQYVNIRLGTPPGSNLSGKYLWAGTGGGGHFR